MKILVVDDEAIVLESCRRILESQGYSVHLAGSADQAISALKADCFDVLLIDIKMPTRDGIDLLREIRRNWPATAVIVMTGYATPETIQESHRSGAEHLIAKPFTPDELLALLGQVISKGGRR